MSSSPMVLKKFYTTEDRWRPAERPGKGYIGGVYMADLVEIKPDNPEIEKQKRIKSEIGKLKKFYKDLPQQKFFLAIRLIERAAFQRVTLEDLEKEINENGVTEVYQNGESQTGVKQSAAVQAYNTMYKNYQATMRDLAAMVPEQRAASRLEQFMKENG